MSDLNFSNRQDLLEEAIECVRYAKIDLGDDNQENPETIALKEQAIQLLNDLREERVSFALKPDIYRLSEKDLKGEDGKLSSKIKARMRNHHFYKIDIPIILKSAPDWAFTDLICDVKFCPDAKESEEVRLLPIIHDLFPSDEWQEIFKLQNSLTVGIDENLAFRAELEELEGKWKNLSSNAQAKIAVIIGGGFQFAFGPFSYRIRTAKIQSDGIGDIQGSWELNGTEYVNEQDIKLGIILKVPKSRQKPINVIAALEAKHSFNIWTLKLFRFKEYFGGTIQTLLKGGVPIKTTHIWEDISSLS